MDGLERLVDQQERVERAHKGLLRSLDRSIIATLREVLIEPKKSMEHLGLQWLDHSRFQKRFSSLVEFFSRIHPHERIGGYNELPLVFMQKTDEEEDRGELNKRIDEFGFLEKRYRELSSKVFYLHFNTNFLWKLQGASDALRIGPLSHFSSVMSKEIPPPKVYGYRITNYPEVLSVDPSVATDYLARTLIHDLGHSFLPQVGHANESLHNVTMVYAMGVSEKSPTDPWQRFVHAECSSPTFFVDAPELFRGLIDSELTPIKKEVVRAYRRWYMPNKGVSAWMSREQQLEFLWGIKPGMVMDDAKRKVYETIESMMLDGFERYDRRL